MSSQSLSSCWLLGQLYKLPEQADEFDDDIRSKIWVTYRKNFPLLDESNRYTSDRGFGCMIRCGQMVLANALIFKNLGRKWKWSPEAIDKNSEIYIKILKLFQDKVTSPYSIHNLVKIDQQDGKNIGDWFGPNTIAQALKKTSNTLIDEIKIEPELMISIDTALDNVVVIQEVKSKFKRVIKLKKPLSKSPNATTIDSAKIDHKNTDKQIDKDEEEKEKEKEKDKSEKEADFVIEEKLIWVPGILFIQLRLGLSKINELYFNALKKSFQFKNSLGIIGGRPNHALYFIGYSDDDIIYLDPHNTQQYVDLEPSNEPTPIEPLTTAQLFTQSITSTLASNFSNLSLPDWTSCGVGGGRLIDDANSDSNNSTTKTTSATTTAAAPATATTTKPSIDATYHCDKPERMPLDRLDPSLALCFYFNTEADFDQWIQTSQDLLIKSEKTPMFEIAQTRAPDWGAPADSAIMEF